MTTVASVDLADQTDALTMDDLRQRGSWKWSTVPAGVIGAGIAEMDLPLAPCIRSAVTSAVDRGLTGYLPPWLAREVAEATATFQRRYGWHVDPADVHVVPDVMNALEQTVRHLLDPDPLVVLPTPAYMPFLRLPKALGWPLMTAPMSLGDNGYAFDLDHLARILRPGALLVLTNPHNPTGRVFTGAELHALAAVVHATGATVFADEIHAALVYPGYSHLPYASLSAITAGHTVTATSASKAWNVPGLACAQLILTGENARARWAKTDPEVAHGASPLGATATVAAYTDGAVHLAAVVDYLDRGRAIFAGTLADSLPEAGFRPPEGTYFGWLDLRPTGCDPTDVKTLARVQGVNGRACGEPGHLRLNLATPHHVVRQMAERLSACRPVV